MYIMTRKILTIEQATKEFLVKTKGKVKESTFAHYSFTCERHILPYFGAIEITELSNKHINDFIQSKLKNGGLNSKPLSAKTVNDMIGLLLQIIKKHSISDMDIEKPSYTQKEVDIFTETEYNKLKSYLSIGTDSRKLGIIIVMLTGIRIGELCALKWENIDLENGIISINKTIQRIKVTGNTKKQKTKIIIDTPKSPTSIRKIPMPLILLNKLKAWEIPTNDDTYLLTNTKQYVEPRVYQRIFKDYLKACEVKDNKFHVLRHTFATTAISKGVDIKTLSVLLGHSDVSFTMKRYVHPNIEHKRIQIEKLAHDF